MFEILEMINRKEVGGFIIIKKRKDMDVLKEKRGRARVL